jgi:hypothetical protein
MGALISNSSWSGQGAGMHRSRRAHGRGQARIGPAEPLIATFRALVTGRLGLLAVATTGLLAVGCAGPAAGGGGASPVATSASARSTSASVSASAAAAAAGGSVAAAPDPNAPEVAAAGDIPDNQVFVPFAAAGTSFTVSVPQGWAQSTAGTATVFTDKFNSVRIDVQPRATAPDIASVLTQDVPRLQAATAGFVLGDVRAVSRSAGPAVLVTYAATSARDAVTGKSVTEAVERCVFWKAGQEVALTLSGPQGADNVDPWRKITDSFRWQR